VSYHCWVSVVLLSLSLSAAPQLKPVRKAPVVHIPVAPRHAWKVPTLQDLTNPETAWPVSVVLGLGIWVSALNRWRRV
jgi:hypothetical protein